MQGSRTLLRWCAENYNLFSQNEVQKATKDERLFFTAIFCFKYLTSACYLHVNFYLYICFYPFLNLFPLRYICVLALHRNYWAIFKHATNEWSTKWFKFSPATTGRYQRAASHCRLTILAIFLHKLGLRRINPTSNVSTCMIMEHHFEYAPSIAADCAGHVLQIEWLIDTHYYFEDNLILLLVQNDLVNIPSFISIT